MSTVPGPDAPGSREALTEGERRLLGLPTFGLALSITIVSTYVPILVRDFTTSGTVIGLVVGGEGFVARSCRCSSARGRTR